MDNRLKAYKGRARMLDILRVSDCMSCPDLGELVELFLADPVVRENNPHQRSVAATIRTELEKRSGSLVIYDEITTPYLVSFFRFHIRPFAQRSDNPRIEQMEDIFAIALAHVPTPAYPDLGPRAPYHSSGPYLEELLNDAIRRDLSAEVIGGLAKALGRRFILGAQSK